MKRSLIRPLVILAITLAVIGCFLQTAQSSPLLKPGERMVLLGDSITEQRIYTRYVMNYFAMRFPGEKISFRNAGWSGDVSPGGFARVQRDVLSLKPNVVSICFGMNDGGYQPFKQDNYDRYIKGMNDLVSALKKADVKVVLLTPGCTDHTYAPYNETLKVYAQGIEEIALKERLPVYNIHELMFNIQTKAKAENTSYTMIPDGVHPSPPGHALMAYGLLQAMGYTGPAASLTLDAEKETTTADRCVVNDLVVKDDAITFVRRDTALPFFFDAEVSSLAKFAPFLAEMNLYMFKATGLKQGNWKLTVQGQEVGKFSSDALAAGVDLSIQPGPWKKLAEDVNNLAREQENLYFTQWRQIDLLDLPADVKPEIIALSKKMDKHVVAKEAEIAKIAANRTWKWSLTLEK